MRTGFRMQRFALLLVLHSGTVRTEAVLQFLRAPDNSVSSSFLFLVPMTGGQLQACAEARAT